MAELMRYKDAEGHVFSLSEADARKRRMILVGPDGGPNALRNLDEVAMPEALEETEPLLESDDTGPEFPKHLGGRTWELSNGERVSGKREEAEAAEAELAQE